MSEVRENKMALRKLSGGIAHAHLRGNIGHHFTKFSFYKDITQLDLLKCSGRSTASLVRRFTNRLGKVAQSKYA